MAVNLKKIIKEKFEPCVLEKGFKYYEPLSKPGANMFTYVKFKGEEPDPSWVKKIAICPSPDREQISIYKNRLEPEITVDLTSTVIPDMKRLGEFAQRSQWWSVATSEEAEAAVDEIVDLLNKYAWDYFILK